VHVPDERDRTAEAQGAKAEEVSAKVASAGRREGLGHGTSDRSRAERGMPALASQ